MKPTLDFSRFRVVTFDCYGTLIDWETGILAAIRPILSANGSKLDDAEILRHYSELEFEAESSEYRPYQQVLREVIRGFGDRLGFPVTEKQQNSLPNSLANWIPFPDTVAALHRLKSRFTLGIISNVDDDLFRATAHCLETDFDYVITASQTRAYKPSPKIFELAQGRIGIPPEEWLHAGQSIYHDVNPAKSLGIATVWVNRPSLRPGAGAARQALGQPDVEVHNLAELADLATG